MFGIHGHAKSVLTLLKIRKYFRRTDAKAVAREVLHFAILFISQLVIIVFPHPGHFMASRACPVSCGFLVVFYCDLPSTILVSKVNQCTVCDFNRPPFCLSIRV